MLGVHWRGRHRVPLFGHPRRLKPPWIIHERDCRRAGHARSVSLPLPLCAWAVLALLLPACRPASPPFASIHEQLMVEPGQALVVTVHTGSVAVMGVDGDQLTLDGNYPPDRTSYALSRSTGTIEVTIERRNGPPAAPSSLRLQVPLGVPVRIETFDADVTVANHVGTVEVNTTAGDIVAERLEGVIALRSGRGNVTLRNSSGTSRVLGEYGVLTLTGVTGDVGSSTIMGTIRFTGQPGHDDTVYLESDHGPIEIVLGSQSDVAVQVNTNSGRLNCVGTHLAYTTAACSGDLGQGAGSLTARTVSGDVMVQVAAN